MGVGRAFGRFFKGFSQGTRTYREQESKRPPMPKEPVEKRPYSFLPMVALLGGATGVALAYMSTSKTIFGRVAPDVWAKGMQPNSNAAITAIIYGAIGLIVGGVAGAIIDGQRRR